MSRKLRARARTRIGRVSIYLHHRAWWVYYRDAGRQVRRKIGLSRDDAEQVAAQVNAQLATGAPTMLAFTPVTVSQLRAAFLDHHESVLQSTLATVDRYRTASKFLETFCHRELRPLHVHEIDAPGFVRYLNQLQVSPNGHPNSKRRRLQAKGKQYVLEVSRSLCAFAAKRRHLPPYAENPFADLTINKIKIEDSKPVFVFDANTEAAFFRAANQWAFPIHFTLAKTGLRPGELTHLLIEDVDLGERWLQVRNKPGLGWRVKTGAGRRVPLIPELTAVLSRVIGQRRSGPVFLRPRFCRGAPPLLRDTQSRLEAEVARRVQSEWASPSRTQFRQIAKSVWRDAGAVKADHIRISFMRILCQLGRPEVTAPKSWRHTFATLLQDANVDPLIRQVTMGHQPTARSGLGMTTVYSHTRSETQRAQIEQALRLWPASLELARSFVEESCDE